MIKKFYFPLTVNFGEREDYGWLDGVKYDARYANKYRDAIESTFDWYNDDDDMAVYFSEYDSKTAKAKIQSMIWCFESVNNCLYGKVIVTLSDELTEKEIEEVKEYICGQNSDGLGEGFEQQEIRIGYDEEIYVSFWNWSDSYWIYDEEEFNRKIRKAD